jgi:hypothetical protein
VAIGLLTLVGLVSRPWGLLGATLAFLTPFVTLSFLVTTPEAWVPALGDAQHGFPYLSGAGRLVLKDVLLLAGAWLVMADSARALLATWVSAAPSPGRTESRLQGAALPIDRVATRLLLRTSHSCEETSMAQREHDIRQSNRREL